MLHKVFLTVAFSVVVNFSYAQQKDVSKTSKSYDLSKVKEKPKSLNVVKQNDKQKVKALKEEKGALETQLRKGDRAKNSPKSKNIKSANKAKNHRTGNG